MTSPTRALPLVLLVATGTAVIAADKELREAKADFDKAAASGDAAALAKLAARLVRTEPPRGALELAGELGTPRRQAALAARDELARVGDPRVARALAERLAATPKPVRARRLLAEALGTVAGDEVARALLHALEDKDPSVRAAAARSLGARGPETAAVASAALRAHALRDASARVRHAAALAGERLGSPAPPGFDVTPAALGLPSRFFVQRIAFLVDASAEARLAAFDAPRDLSPVAAVPSATLALVDSTAKVKRAPPKLVSALDVAGAAFASALVRLSDDASFQAIAFNERPFPSSPRFVRATSREVGDARDWLLGEGFPSSDDRDLVSALRQALEADPPPDEVWLAMAGVPSGRGLEGTAAALALGEEAWDQGVVIHVVLFELEPPGPPRDERERVAREHAAAERIALARGLAASTGGRVMTVPLLRPVAPVVSSSKPAEKERPLLHLEGGRIPPRDVPSVRRRLDEALKAGAEDVLERLAKELAAAPDETAAELALRALEEGPLGAERAAIDGFAHNKAAKVAQLLASELRARTDARRGVLVARALAAMPGPEVARALAEEAERREGQDDVLRILFAALSRRPVEELAPIATEIAAAAKRARTGLSLLEVRRALAAARGAPAVREPAGPADDRFLHEAFAASGVAFLVDAERAIDERFDPRVEEKKAPEGAKKAPPPPAPRSRRTVVAAEVVRALETVSQEHGHANVITLADGARSWKPHASSLAKGALAEAESFVETVPCSAGREVLRPLEKALEDPEVEEVWVLAAGTPLRSDADLDAPAARRRIEELAFHRGVRVHVVLPLGDPGATDEARAARKDEVARLEAFWWPIAASTGGQLLLRDHARMPALPAPEKRGGVAAVATPTRR